MNFINIFQKKIIFFLTFIVLIPLLNSCQAFKWDPADARKVSPRADDRVKKNLEEGRGFTLMGQLKGDKGGTSYQFASSNVMWRATLEILDFLPLANVDYSGGIITTDWYNEGVASDESIKITVRFLTNEIRADGIKVIVHKKKCSLQQECSVKKITSTLSNELRAAILKKAVIYQKTDKSNKPKRKIDKIWTDKPD